MTFHDNSCYFQFSTVNVFVMTVNIEFLIIIIIIMIILLKQLQSTSRQCSTTFPQPSSSFFVFLRHCSILYVFCILTKWVSIVLFRNSRLLGVTKAYQ